MGNLSGARTRDYADLTEDSFRPVYECVLTEASVGAGARMLDITDVLTDVVAEGAIDHNTPTGPQTSGPQVLAGIVQAFRTGFPDLRVEIEREVAEQDYVVQYGYLIGTNNGEFFGRPATAKPARVAYMDMHRISDGKIVESWHIADYTGMMRQLA